MARTFTASVDAWVRASAARVEAVFKESARDVFRHAQRPVAAGGNMPVRTGNLRRSLLSSTSGGIALAAGEDSYVLAIAGARLGDIVTGVWTASYARYVEYGVGGRSGRRFVGLAAENWQAIVARNVRRAKARSR